MSFTRVLVRPGALAALPAELPPAPARFLVTDAHVAPLLPAALAALPGHVLPPGETSKSWEELGRLLGAFAAAGLQRDAQVLAVGGGVVTDLAGLAASLHRRGVAWCAVPTTLIGQVDAALGGKTAVNLGGAKNAVGTFHPPLLVLADPAVLASLPPRELRAGLAEMLKTALVSGEELLAGIERLQPTDLVRGDARAAEWIARCLAVKQDLVERDPRDHGARQALNLGHTFGHAFEALALPELRHGEAVGLGLLCAARLARLTATSGEPHDATARPEGADAPTGIPVEARVRACLQRWGLPVTSRADPAAVLEALRHDKKGRAEGPLFVLPDGPGRLRLQRAPAPGLVQAALQAVRD